MLLKELSSAFIVAKLPPMYPSITKTIASENGSSLREKYAIFLSLFPGEKWLIFTFFGWREAEASQTFLLARRKRLVPNQTTQ